MTIKAVVFDIGGVLERVDSPAGFTGKWQTLLGMSEEEFDTASGRVDRAFPADGDRPVTPRAYRRCWIDALSLSEIQADEFMCDLWDWYCGELDSDLMSFAAGLRPKYVPAILSNSGPGAREEEERRYRFSHVFDPIVYSHEVGLAKPDPAIYALICALLHVEPHEAVFLDDTRASVDGANEYGMIGVLHTSTPESIRTISALLE